MKLLIHHHAPIYTDKKGMHVQSFIGMWVDELAKYFDEIGLLFSVIGTKGETQDYIIRSNNVVFHQLPENRGGKNRVSRYVSISKISKLIEHTYDVLLIRGITPKQSVVLNSFIHIRKVFMLVGSLEQGKPEFGLSVQKLYRWLMFFKRKYEFTKISNKAKLLANSPILCEEIKRLTGKSALYIPTNTISLTDFNPIERTYESGLIRLLFVGRVTTEKGILELLQAVIKLSISKKSFCLDIVGPIEIKFRKKIEAIIRNQKNVKIKLHGYIPFGERLFEFYRRAHIYILPSYHEGFPHSLWEAAAFNLPIITTKVGGIPGIVNSSQVYFVLPKNEHDLYEAIQQVIDEKEERTSKVQRMRKLALNNTVENTANKLANYLSRFEKTKK